MEDRPLEKRVNVPNLLAAFRLVGSFVLIGLTLAGITGPFPWLLLALFLSDWLDGKLAILLRQRTTFGARLDSVADAAMYGALLVGVVLLKWDFVQKHWIWIAAVPASYVLTCAVGIAKYRRIPSYHTRLAKTTWLLIGLAAINLFADGPLWPFRVAMICAVLANVETLVMSLLLSQWYADVPSVLHAWRLRRAEREGLSPPALHEPVND